MALGGFLIGGFKVLVRFPEGETQTFFQEVKSMNVHWREGFATSFCGFISLSSGASLGPEAPLGAFGGALGAWLGECCKRSKPVVEMWVLCGMGRVVRSYILLAGARGDADS
jgi:H+/Cl- antiporter ClcA